MASAGLRPPEGLFLRYPHELSGGQRQRVLIAGALALGPELLIADEPVSSLDASIRGEILALLLKLRDELGLGVLVVTHDLGLAWNIADRIAVMYLGRVVESGPTEEVLQAPQHPYTQALLSVVPEIEELRAGRAARRDPRPDPDPRRLPVPPALPGARRRLGGGRRRRRTPAATPAAGSCPRTPTATTSPATWRALRSPPAREDRGASCEPCRPRCPGRCTSTRTAWLRERDRVLCASGSASAGSATSGWPSAGRVAVVDVVGESVLVTRDEDGALHAAYNVCRHRGSQLVPDPAGRRADLCGGGCAALPLPLVDLLAGRLSCCGPRTPTASRPGGVLAAPGRRARSGRASSSCT